MRTELVADLATFIRIGTSTLTSEDVADSGFIFPQRSTLNAEVVATVPTLIP